MLLVLHVSYGVTCVCWCYFCVTWCYTYLLLLPVFAQGGHVFRLQIHHHREVVLLKERLAESQPAAGLKEAAAATHKEMVALPVLTSSLNG